MDLFDIAYRNERNITVPLAERMRPICLEDFYGQDHIVGKNTLLRRSISIDRLGSCVFYGTAGCGKTSLASIISKMTNSPSIILNAVTIGVAEAKKIMDEAKHLFHSSNKRTYLILDECHRWNKAQSDSLLAPIEQGYIVFIGTTTENPYISLTKALLSRCKVFQFKKLSPFDIKLALKASIKDKRGLENLNIKLTDDALEHFAYFADGDLRSAYNSLELAALTTKKNQDGTVLIDKEVAISSTGGKNLSLDESLIYDMLSAFCKSLRGSDSDAAVYWSERMISGGVDPLTVARRLVVHSSEDVGMADPFALTIAMNALNAIEKIGLPECRIPLTEAIIYVAEASKSNSVVRALDKANMLVTTVKDDNVPKSLQDPNYKGETIGGYKYPHEYGGYIPQQYLPDMIKNEQIYEPGENGYEGKLIRAKVIGKNKG